MALRRFAPGSSGYDWFSKWVVEDSERFQGGELSGPIPILMLGDAMYL